MNLEKTEWNIFLILTEKSLVFILKRILHVYTFFNQINIKRIPHVYTFLIKSIFSEFYMYIRFKSNQHKANSTCIYVFNQINTKRTLHVFTFFNQINIKRIIHVYTFLIKSTLSEFYMCIRFLSNQHLANANQSTFLFFIETNNILFQFLGFKFFNLPQNWAF